MNEPIQFDATINTKFSATFQITNMEEEIFIANMVNVAYSRGEEGMWKDDAKRTSPEEIKQFGENNNIIVVKEKEIIVGSVYVTNCFNENSELGELGMLAVNKEYLGQGIGTLLINCAEEYCKKSNCKQIRLELLTPKSYEHPFKKRLNLWYTKLKYKKGITEDFNSAYPQIVPMLACDCDFTVYTKDL